MTSVHSSSLDADEVDLSGLVESVVDSDEEDLAESMDVRIPSLRVMGIHLTIRYIYCCLWFSRAWLSVTPSVSV